MPTDNLRKVQKTLKTPTLTHLRKIWEEKVEIRELVVKRLNKLVERIIEKWKITFKAKRNYPYMIHPIIP